MKFWKIRHNPSGLFWGNGSTWQKDGKAYARKHYATAAIKNHSSEPRGYDTDKYYGHNHRNRKRSYERTGVLPYINPEECSLVEFQTVIVDEKLIDKLIGGNNE